MITRLWSLTLLVTQLVLGFDHSIDLERCKTGETACFIRESCYVDKSVQTDPEFATRQKTLVQYKAERPLKNDNCDAVIQMKALTSFKMHVMMQVKLQSGSSDKIKLDDGIVLNQETDQFVCKLGGISGATKLKFDPTGKQIYDEQRLFCSFFAEMNDHSNTFPHLYRHNGKQPKLIFMKTSNDKDEITWDSIGNELWGKPLLTCDRAIVTTALQDDPEKETIWAEVDTTTDTFKCDTKFVLKLATDNPISPSEVKCVVDKWKYKDDDGPPKEIVGAFEVYCPVKRCRQCTTAPPLLSSCTGCTPTVFDKKEATPDDCPTFTCPDKKWTTTGKEIIVGEAECKNSVADPTKFGWFLNNAELTVAACMKKFDCGLKPDLPDALKEQIIGYGTTTIKCKNATSKPWKFRVDARLGYISELDISAECNQETGKFNFSTIHCYEEFDPNADPSAAGWGATTTGLFAASVLLFLALLIFFLAWIVYDCCIVKRRKKKAAAAKAAANSTKKTNKSTGSSTAPPGDADGSEGRKKSSRRDSKKSKKDKLKLEDFPTWDNEQFTKKILPNFKSFDPDSKGKWVRNYLGRFYAYCNTKKTPESGTFNQYWLLVKQCADDKCEDASVWVELWRCAFTIGYSILERNTLNDEMRARLMKPFESYMLDYYRKCEHTMRKDEPRSETEMRIICIEVLLHTRHPDVTDTLRKLTFNEKLEVPLRMLTAACYTRERDEKPKTVEEQYKRVLEQSILDPHIAEGWGTYLQHCCFGLGAYLITEKNVYQYKFFEELYQVALTKDSAAPRKFSPSDWMYAYKGACLHENSAKIALDCFMKLNDDCLLHIDTLLKQKHADDADEREKDREQYKKDMKEYTLLLADLLIGEGDFDNFKPHLRSVILFIGDLAKTGEPLSEDRIRERAINMGNMVRDRDFVKECNESLKAIGAKEK